MLKKSSIHRERRAPRLRLEFLECRRLLSAGGLDPTFGRHGVAAPDFGLTARSVAVGGDGKVLLLGQTPAGYGLVRYNADGSLDGGFGAGGKVSATFGDGTSVVDLAVLADGRVVVCGERRSGEDHFLNVARFNRDGTADTSFDGDGLFESSLGLAVEDMAVFADGAVVLAGTLDHSTAAVRLDTAGALDLSFGGDGVVTTDLGGDSRATGVAVQADGKVVVTGFGGGKLALVRYDTGGGLDASFGAGGVASAALPGTAFAGSRVAVDGGTGKVVVVADSLSVEGSLGGWNSRQNHTTLLRFDAGGSLDSGFGTRGQVSRSAWASLSFADNRAHHDVALQGDGKVLVAGDSYGSAVVTRYASDGSIDLTFGNGGSAVVSSGLAPANTTPPPALAVQADGRVVVASNATSWDGGFRTAAQVARLEADGEARPARFGSAAAFRAYLIDQAVRQYSWYFGRRLPSPHHPYYFLDHRVMALAATSDSAALPTFSRTHNQVQGVEEGDSVKTDGRYLYVLTGGKLVILDAWPAPNLRSLSETALSGTPLVQYLQGNRLTVITQEYLPVEGSPHDGRVACWVPFWGYRSRPVVKITVFDVSDRASPTVVQVTTLDGQYNSSRAVGEKVYVALNNNSIQLPAPEYTTDGDGVLYQTEAEYRAWLETLPLDRYLPQYTTRVTGADGTEERAGVLTAPEDIYRPGVPGDNSLVTLVSIDTEGSDAGLTDSVSLLTSHGATLYATASNFYLITNRWSSAGNWTYIDKLSLRDGRIGLAATGRVPGAILNQFSVSENGDYLYIATTAGWGRAASASVYVLAQDGDSLGVVGRVEDLAPGEMIYSVRFLGDRAFVCTFERIDPLFAIDLSDPAAPVVAGKLEVTGYSGYLQAISPTHLIGIGRDADPVTGRVTDLIISLFDVSDLNNPRLVSRYRVAADGWAWSQAEYDFRAITWYPEMQMLTLPVSSQRQVAPGDGTLPGWVTQTDLLVFHVDTDSGTLELRGETSDGGMMRRGVFIGDVLYSVSDVSVQAHSLDDLTTPVAQVQLPAPESPVWWWGHGWILPIAPLPVRVVAVIEPLDVPTGGTGEGNDPPLPAAEESTPPASSDLVSTLGEVAADAPAAAPRAARVSPRGGRAAVPPAATTGQGQDLNALLAALAAPRVTQATEYGDVQTVAAAVGVSPAAVTTLNVRADINPASFAGHGGGHEASPAVDDSESLPAENAAQDDVWSSFQADSLPGGAGVTSRAAWRRADGRRAWKVEDGRGPAASDDEVGVAGEEISPLWTLAFLALMPAHDPVASWQRVRRGY